MKLILAGNSPRRKQMLSEYGYSFTAINSGFCEKQIGKSGLETCLFFASKKAELVFNLLSDNERARSVVLGADTLVCFNGKILGKPKDSDDAIKTLKSLSDKSHFVFTAYAVLTSEHPTPYAFLFSVKTA